MRTVAFWAIVGLLVAVVPAFAVKNKATPNPAKGTWTSGNKKLAVDNGWFTPLTVVASGPEGTREGSGQWLSDHSFLVDYGKTDITYHLKGNLLYTIVDNTELYYQKTGP